MPPYRSARKNSLSMCSHGYFLSSSRTASSADTLPHQFASARFCRAVPQYSCTVCPTNRPSRWFRLFATSTREHPRSWCVYPSPSPSPSPDAASNTHAHAATFSSYVVSESTISTSGRSFDRWNVHADSFSTGRSSIAACSRGGYPDATSVVRHAAIIAATGLSWSRCCHSASSFCSPSGSFVSIPSSRLSLARSNSFSCFSVPLASCLQLGSYGHFAHPALMYHCATCRGYVSCADSQNECVNVRYMLASTGVIKSSRSGSVAAAGSYRGVSSTCSDTATPASSRGSSPSSTCDVTASISRVFTVTFIPCPNPTTDSASPPSVCVTSSRSVVKSAMFTNAPPGIVDGCSSACVNSTRARPAIAAVSAACASPCRSRTSARSTDVPACRPNPATISSIRCARSTSVLTSSSVTGSLGFPLATLCRYFAHFSCRYRAASTGVNRCGAVSGMLPSAVVLCQ
eukprot:Rhum_TRINITY_DN15168_c1_g1::Rhum_TRINITY_DN15168_c1_g1_i1::g.141028::m.141028